MAGAAYPRTSLIVTGASGASASEVSRTRCSANVARIAPSTSISRIAGRAMLVMPGPRSGAVVANCETISSATADSGDIAQPVQNACRRLVPLPQLARETPAIFATARVITSVATRPTTAWFHGALAATTYTSTNISMVRSDEALPSWRGHAHGRGWT